MQLRREERCKYTENRNNSVTTLPNHLVQKYASYDYFRIGHHSFNLRSNPSMSEYTSTSFRISERLTKVSKQFSLVGIELLSKLNCILRLVLDLQSCL